jgi:hypothetical protein
VVAKFRNFDRVFDRVYSFNKESDCNAKESEPETLSHATVIQSSRYFPERIFKPCSPSLASFDHDISLVCPYQWRNTRPQSLRCLASRKPYSNCRSYHDVCTFTRLASLHRSASFLVFSLRIQLKLHLATLQPPPSDAVSYWSADTSLSDIDLTIVPLWLPSTISATMMPYRQESSSPV